MLRDTVSSATEEFRHTLIAEILKHTAQCLRSRRTLGSCLLDDTVQLLRQERLTLDRLSSVP